MKEVLDQKRTIEKQALDLGAQIRLETRVCAAELEERQRLQLHGDDAVEHYNSWMRKYGLNHLTI